MGRDWSGSLDGRHQRHALIISKWNEFITKNLLAGAQEALASLSVPKENIDLIHVPGAFELGPCAHLAAKSGRYDAVTCLGCVIRGGTPHFEHISKQCARLISQAAYDSGIPVIFGVLTVDTTEQAVERAGAKSSNKGYEAGMAAVETANLYRDLKGTVC